MCSVLFPFQASLRNGGAGTQPTMSNSSSTTSMPICRYSKHAHLQVQPACPSAGTASMSICRYSQHFQLPVAQHRTLQPPEMFLFRICQLPRIEPPNHLKCFCFLPVAKHRTIQPPDMFLFSESASCPA